MDFPRGQSLTFCILQSSNSPGWMVFQQRKFGTVDFYRNWEDYKNGFGSFEGDFWAGLENVHQVS